MAARVLHHGDRGADVMALQRALRLRAEPRFYPPLALDGELGPATRRAFEALGWALGFTEETLSAGGISVTAQALLASPDDREPEQLKRARARGPRLHERTVAFDGAPTYWGLAKPLLLAREHGWGGRLTSSDRRKGVAEQFGKKSQFTLHRCMQRRIALGRCPADCGGDCADANAPGSSSHEQLSDARAFEGPVGRKLAWWQLGLDVGDSDGLLVVLDRLGYKIKRTYPKNPREHHHLNFTASPGRVLPGEGPLAKPGKPSHSVRVAAGGKAAATPSSARVTLTGPDVSENQPDVTWANVKAAGHDFAIAKVSDGLGTPDPAFGKGRWKAMRDAGLIRGSYHFGRPQKGRNPVDEVEEFLTLLKAAGGLDHGDLVPVLDLEKHGAAGKLTPTDTLEWARQWAAELRRRIGRRPIIYTGGFWRETMRNPADDLDCKLWLAAYVPKAKLPPLIPVAWKEEGLRLWQHTDTGRCSGIDGNCDLNRFDGPRAKFDSLRM